MVMYRSIWCCIGVYDICIGVYGYVWGCMVMYRSIWCCIWVYGVV